jgi:hypothetical protein
MRDKAGGPFFIFWIWGIIGVTLHSCNVGDPFFISLFWGTMLENLSSFFGLGTLPEILSSFFQKEGEFWKSFFHFFKLKLFGTTLLFFNYFFLPPF